MRTQRRVAVGILIALCGIAIGVGSQLSWIRARGTRPAAGITHVALSSVQHWSLQATGSYLKSFAFAVVIAGALVFLGRLFASRVVAGIFAAIALAAAIIWLTLEAGKYSSVNLPFSDLRIGGLLTAGAALVALVGHRPPAPPPDLIVTVGCQRLRLRWAGGTPENADDRGRARYA